MVILIISCRFCIKLLPFYYNRNNYQYTIKYMLASDNLTLLNNLMGNQQDRQIQYPKTSVIHHLISAIRLNNVNNHTKSFLNRSFATNLNKLDRGTISRKLNPFCVLQLEYQDQEIQKWTQCCMVSPIMAIASLSAIYGTNTKQKISMLVKGMTDQGYIQSPIVQVIIADKQNICLLVLGHPIWELGWAGITYIQNEKQITQKPFQSISHPSRIPSEKVENEFIYTQILSNVIISKQKQFLGVCKGNIGGLVFQIRDLKPYILGYQKNENEIFFFDEPSYKQILKGVSTYLKNDQVEKQIIKSIDIRKFEIQTQW